MADWLPVERPRSFHVEWFGDQAAKVTYEDFAVAVANRLVYRNEDSSLGLVETGRLRSFDGGGRASEARSGGLPAIAEQPWNCRWF